MDSKTLGALFANARKQPLSFAMLVGKNDMILEAHRTKSVSVMRQLARGAGGGPKGAYGTMKLVGKKLIVTCEEEPYGTFSQDAKRFFATHGQNVQVIVNLTTEPEDAEEVPERGPVAERQEPDAEEGAPPDTDADDDNAETDYGKIIATARKGQINFAWLLGKEAPVLRAHRNKTVPVLVKAAKADGGMQRGAWGQFSIAGKVIVLTCPEDPPSTFARAARLQLRSAGFKYQIEVHGPSGITMSADEENEEATGAGASVNEAASGDALDAAPEYSVDDLMTQYRQMFEKIKPLLSGGDPGAVLALKSEIKGVSQALVARDTTTAAALLQSLGRHIAPKPVRRVSVLPDLLALEGRLDALLAEMAPITA